MDQARFCSLSGCKLWVADPSGLSHDSNVPFASGEKALPHEFMIVQAKESMCKQGQL